MCGLVLSRRVKEKGNHPTQNRIPPGTHSTASSQEEILLDPFVVLHNRVVAKAGTQFIGIDNVEEYIALTKKRLEGI